MALANVRIKDHLKPSSAHSKSRISASKVITYATYTIGCFSRQNDHRIDPVTPPKYSIYQT